MNKDIILNEIHKNGSQMRSYGQHIISINRIKNKIVKSRLTATKLIIHLLTWHFISWNLTNSLKPFNLESFLGNLSFFFSFFGYPIIVIGFMYLKRKKLNQEIQQHTKDATDLFHHLKHKKVIIPAKYWHEYPLSRFYEYLTTYRADNLKECVQIYEKEMMHNKQIGELKNMHKTLQKMDGVLQNIDQNVNWMADISRIKYYEKINKNTFLHKK